MWFVLKVSLLAARNERESVQIAMRPKASWGGLSGAGTVQIRCSDLCSSSGDRLRFDSSSSTKESPIFVSYFIIVTLVA